MCTCVWVYVYVPACGYLHMCLCVYLHLCLCEPICICACVWISVCVPVSRYVHVSAGVQKNERHRSPETGITRGSKSLNVDTRS